MPCPCTGFSVRHWLFTKVDGKREGLNVLDVIFLFTVCIFFLLIAGFVSGCARLKQRG